MKKEIEAKFLDINHDAFRVRLEEYGAVQESSLFLMKRLILDFPDRRLARENAFARIRQEHSRVTMAFKQFESATLEGVNEAEVVVEDFDDALNFCNSLGMVVLTSQESKREVWRKDETEIVLDEWPWLEPYVEIEAPNSDLVRKVSNDLDLDWKHAVFGDVMSAYRHQYPHLNHSDKISTIPDVRFGDPLPQMLRIKL